MREAAWPRAGGAALYASAALAKASVAAAPLTWIGDDADGEFYRAACGSLAGVAVTPGAPSTRCLLIYNADGSYGCLLRPGPAELTDAQLRLAAEATSKARVWPGSPRTTRRASRPTSSRA
jgi:ribokinase